MPNGPWIDRDGTAGGGEDGAPNDLPGTDDFPGIDDLPGTEDLPGTDDVLDAALPRDLGEALGRLVGQSRVEDLREWATAVRRLTGGGPIGIEDLCHAEPGTGHWGDLGGTRYHFACFYDAVILAALAERPVGIRTESPDGTVIEGHAAGDGGSLRVTPAGAVFSFGVIEGVSPSAGEPSHADVYRAICPAVRAFPDPSAYRRWTATAPVTTVATALEDATALAGAVARDG